MSSQQLSVPASKLREGQERHSVADATVDELQQQPDPEHPAEPLPDASVEWFSAPADATE